LLFNEITAQIAEHVILDRQIQIQSVARGGFLAPSRWIGGRGLFSLLFELLGGGFAVVMINNRRK
jgi:hypothetical protein